MIDIKIYGCSKDVKLKTFVKKATVYFVYTLVPKKRNLKLKIVLIKDLAVTESIYGECYDTSDDEIWHDYLIRLDYGLDIPTIIKTLAHELVHFKQFYRGELKMLNHHILWKKAIFPYDDSYENLPWEIEANSLEPLLYDSFIKQNEV